MSGDVLYVFAVLAATIVLFLSDRVRLDVVALLVIVALTLGGQLSAADAVAGFGEPLVILIAGLFVVGEALVRTGIAHAVGTWLARVAGSDEVRLLCLLMVVVAVLSAFMSSTGAVAVLIPVVLGLAARTGLSAGRLLMPLAAGALIGGMLTLIGTPPNLVVNAQLTREGLEPFGFFAFTPIGLLVLLAAIAYMVLVGRRLLQAEPPRPDDGDDRASLQELAEAHDLQAEFARLEVFPDSPLVGRTIAEARLHSRYGVAVVAIDRPGHGRRREFVPALPDTRLDAGDILLAAGPETATAHLIDDQRLGALAIDPSTRDEARRQFGGVEVLIAPESRLIGQTVQQAQLRARFGLVAIAVSRKGERIRSPVDEIHLEFGDILVLAGAWERIPDLQRARRDFLVLRVPTEMDEVAPARARAPLALGVVLAMLVLMTFDLVPGVTAVLMAALVLVLGGCVGMTDAYRAINWQSLVLIAGMIPMATALERSGGVALIVDGLMATFADASPHLLMAALFLLTSVLSQVISNTATTVLLAPIAIGAAAGLGVSPYPLLMAVAIAASTAFATPVASPVNTLILGPGGYRFVDFVKVGVPLQLIAMVVALLAIPLLFQF